MTGTVELIKVEPNANNNKFYRMVPSDDTFTVTFGRVGASGQQATYPMRAWNSKYNEKIRKGYVDVTGLRDTSAVDHQAGYKAIEDAGIAKLVEELLSKARQTVKRNYLITADAVTPAMIHRAQGLLNNLTVTRDVEEFNAILTRLFTTIPRSMKQVKDYLAKSEPDMPDVVKREQELLDVLSSQVQNTAPKPETVSDKTILEEAGLTVKPATKAELAKIKKLLGNGIELREAWQVTNVHTQEVFDKRQQQRPVKTQLLWHGSRTENWWSILGSGLLLRPTNAVINGKMFGHGIYFAPSARKSLGYTSLHNSYWAGGSDNHGYMALMEVATGDPYNIYEWQSKFGGLNAEQLQKVAPGKDSVHAHAGKSLKNDEIIVYTQEQVTIKYLVRVA